VSASQAGDPASYSVLARDHHGGATVTVYRVHEPGRVEIVNEAFDWSGAQTKNDTKTCRALVMPIDPFGDPTCTT
jgi:hypothetical protein